MAEWIPLSGKDKERAEDELLRFKKALDKEFKKGRFTADRCREMVKEKEVELGLAQPPSMAPPTESAEIPATEQVPAEVLPEAPTEAQPEEQIPSKPTPTEEIPPPPVEEAAPESQPEEPQPIPKEEAMPMELGVEPAPGELPVEGPTPEQPSETITCESCGAILSAGVTVCEVCGAQVPGSEELATEEPAPEPEQPAEPMPAPVSAWVPLSPKDQKHAEKEIFKFKKHLEKEFEKGRMSADECKAQLKQKEIELGLVPPLQPVPEEAPTEMPTEDVPTEPAPEEQPEEVQPEAQVEAPPEEQPVEEPVPEEAPAEEITVEALECPACGATSPLGTEKCEVCGTVLLVKEEGPVPERIQDEEIPPPPVEEQRAEEAYQPAPAIAPAFIPLSPKEQKSAEKEIYKFKKYLDKEYRKGRMDADETRVKIKEKEIELRLVAPTEVQYAPPVSEARPPAEVRETIPEVSRIEVMAQAESRSEEYPRETPSEIPAPEEPVVEEPVYEAAPIEAAVEEEKVEEAPQRAPAIAPIFVPLSPKDQKRAEKELYHFKKYLDKEYKKGRMSADQCRSQLKRKEAELGLAPPPIEVPAGPEIAQPVEEVPAEIPVEAPTEEMPETHEIPEAEELVPEEIPETPTEEPVTIPEEAPVEEPKPEIPAEEMMECRFCGAQIPASSETCEICGEELIKKKVPEPKIVAPIAAPVPEQVPEEELPPPPPVEAETVEETPPPTPVVAPIFVPLAPKEQKHAEKELYKFKKYLDKEYRKGRMGADDCRTQLREKEIELGLVSPTGEAPPAPEYRPSAEEIPEAPVEVPMAEEPIVEEPVPEPPPEIPEEEAFPEPVQEIPEDVPKEEEPPQPDEAIEEIVPEPVPEEAKPEAPKEEIPHAEPRYVEKPEAEKEVSKAVKGEVDLLDREEQNGIECLACGALLAPGATKCSLCKTELPKGLTPVFVKEKLPAVVEEGPALGEIACPNCGAFVAATATECPICDAKLGGKVKHAKKAVPEPITEIPEEVKEEPEEELPPAPPPPPPEPEKEQILCPGCGAFLEQGSTECFICGARLGEEPVEEKFMEEPVPETKVEPEMELETAPDQEPATEEVEELVEEVELKDGEIICPSCSSIIPEGKDKCPECWTDLTQYMKCPSCGMLTPAGEDACKHCLAPIAISVEEIEETIEEEVYLPEEVVIPETEISPELEQEMSSLDTDDEQGKECTVCGAIFGPEDELCPVCKQPYGTVLEEPPEMESAWEGMGVELAPTTYICPHCKEKIKGVDATEREENERKWFYWGIIIIFTGIFFNSFSIWVRGITLENESLGLHPGPADAIVNILGWILVIIGFVFWFMSWRKHEGKIECPKCGVEVTTDMAMCINCGAELEFDEEPGTELDEEKEAEEELEEEVPAEVVEEKVEAEIAETTRPKGGRKIEMAPEPEPTEEITEDIPEAPVDEGPFAEEEEPEVPEEVEEPPVLLKPIPSPKAEKPAKPIHSKKKAPADELPVDHEEHKKCPACGIYVELDAIACPVCDASFDVKPVPDKEIEVPSETEELENLGEPLVGDAEIEGIQTNGKYVEIPESTETNESVEKELAALAEEEANGKTCPKCGAIMQPGKKCPVCGNGAGALSEPGPAGEGEVDCPSCGAAINAGDEVCPICEYPIKANNK